MSQLRSMHLMRLLLLCLSIFYCLLWYMVFKMLYNLLFMQQGLYVFLFILCLVFKVDLAITWNASFCLFVVSSELSWMKKRWVRVRQVERQSSFLSVCILVVMETLSGNTKTGDVMMWLNHWESWLAQSVLGPHSHFLSRWFLELCPTFKKSESTTNILNV